MISVGYMIKGVLPKVLGGRNDKLGTVKQLWQCATQYKQKNPNTTVAAFSIVYIALQTFAIPGPIVLSILSGALYPFVNAQVLVAACATTGASLCFMLSYFFGRGVLHRLMPEMLDKFQKKVWLLLCYMGRNGYWGRFDRMKAICFTIYCFCGLHRYCRIGL